MTYAYVEDGSVQFTQPGLPSSWRNISNFSNLSDEQALAYGWYPIVVAELTPLAFGEYYGPYYYVVGSTTVSQERDVLSRTVADQKVWLRSIGRSAAEQRLAEEYNLQYQIAALSGELGVDKRDEVKARLAFYIAAFETFREEVNACSTTEELEAVYNNYPQLQEVDD